MLDTAKLTAAVETLQLYCEHVRLVMNARGYLRAHVHTHASAVESGDGRLIVWVHLDAGIDQRATFFDSGDVFAEALAYAESLPYLPGPFAIAATLGISPDGRVLEQVEG